MAIPITSQAPTKSKTPLVVIVFIAITLVVGIFAVLFFLRPEAVPAPAILLDKFLPKGSAIQELEKIELNFDVVLSHPVFRTLREFGPVPLTPPSGGKTNPFF